MLSDRRPPDRDTAEMPLTVRELEHWVQFGAAWRLERSEGDHAVVDMLSCTGELVERREADEPEVVAYVRRLRAQPPAADH
jgi:hypothetical protein